VVGISVIPADRHYGVTGVVEITKSDFARTVEFISILMAYEEAEPLSAAGAARG